MSIQNRYEFVLLFDVIDGNPNGDPDAGNVPRLDPETGKGLVTDVCLKRKIRNYVGLTKGEQAPYEIYVKEKAVLNEQNERAYVNLNLNAPIDKVSDNTVTESVEDNEKATKKIAKESKKRKGSADDVEKARNWMCQNFYDVRTFGAVMSTGVNCGQVRGPVQLTFARSIDPIFPLDHSITRMAVTKKEDAIEQQGDNRTMGRKHTVSYGLYRAHGFISAHLAQQTAFSQSDLNLLWEALQYMFEHDRSAARGQMSTRGLYVFQHKTMLGNAPAHQLFDLVQVQRRNEKTVAAFADYQININEATLPAEVTLLRLIG